MTSALIDRGALEQVIATKAFYYDTGISLAEEVDEKDLAPIVATVDAVMELVRPMPTREQIKAALSVCTCAGNPRPTCPYHGDETARVDAVMTLLNGSET